MCARERSKTKTKNHTKLHAPRNRYVYRDGSDSMGRGIACFDDRMQLKKYAILHGKIKEECISP